MSAAIHILISCSVLCGLLLEAHKNEQFKGIDDTQVSCYSSNTFNKSRNKRSPFHLTWAFILALWYLFIHRSFVELILINEDDRHEDTNSRHNFFLCVEYLFVHHVYFIDAAIGRKLRPQNNFYVSCSIYGLDLLISCLIRKTVQLNITKIRSIQKEKKHYRNVYFNIGAASNCWFNFIFSSSSSSPFASHSE